MLMDSRPPAAMTRAEPARIWSHASMTLRMAEPHILLTVVAGVLAGMPRPGRPAAPALARRPADSTQPMMTSSISAAGNLRVRERRLEGGRAELRAGQAGESP